MWNKGKSLFFGVQEKLNYKMSLNMTHDRTL